MKIEFLSRILLCKFKIAIPSLIFFKPNYYSLLKLSKTFLLFLFLISFSFNFFYYIYFYFFYKVLFIGLQILTDFAHFCQFLPVFVSFCPFLPVFAHFRQFLSIFVSFCPFSFNGIFNFLKKFIKIYNFKYFFNSSKNLY